MLLLTLFYVAGIVFILLSIYLKFWRGRRKFNRRNPVGRETFSSYKKAVLVSSFEDLIKTLSTILMVLGIILLLAAYFDPEDIKRVTHW